MKKIRDDTIEKLFKIILSTDTGGFTKSDAIEFIVFLTDSCGLDKPSLEDATIEAIAKEQGLKTDKNQKDSLNKFITAVL